ncbi:hypothetical protein CSKR_106230 [Clonorchis sinensis]|uniref:Uncharacterized protein n=1 Tax=Clonorchis sinensis TaxID=79923 RepID=A0A3R7CDC8_CLOSI|nr:hypothetical protein CSKR_106230 [Clonorchis sinensis]
MLQRDSINSVTDLTFQETQSGCTRRPNATKRLHKFHKRSHFSRDAKRIYEKTCYSHASSVVSTVTPVHSSKIAVEILETAAAVILSPPQHKHVATTPESVSFVTGLKVTEASFLLVDSSTRGIHVTALFLVQNINPNKPFQFKPSQINLSAQQNLQEIAFFLGISGNFITRVCEFPSAEVHLGHWYSRCPQYVSQSMESRIRAEITCVEVVQWAS